MVEKLQQKRKIIAMIIILTSPSGKRRVKCKEWEKTLTLLVFSSFGGKDVRPHHHLRRQERDRAQVDADPGSEGELLPASDPHLARRGAVRPLWHRRQQQVSQSAVLRVLFKSFSCYAGGYQKGSI